jgi:hypothetical protein
MLQLDTTVRPFLRAMLNKMPTRQIDGEPRRQWIADDYFDLYVWYQPDDSIYGFQLCYEKQTKEQAITWLRMGAFRHECVDAGEDSPMDNRSPVMAQTCQFQREPLKAEFIKRSVNLEPEIRDLVLSKIDAFPTD